MSNANACLVGRRTFQTFPQRRRPSTFAEIHRVRPLRQIRRSVSDIGMMESIVACEGMILGGRNGDSATEEERGSPQMAGWSERACWHSARAAAACHRSTIGHTVRHLPGRSSAYHDSQIAQAVGSGLTGTGRGEHYRLEYVVLRIDRWMRLCDAKHVDGRGR